MDLITFDNMSEKLIEMIPELKNQYIEECKWWGDETPGAHIIYGNLLDPFLEKLLNSDGNDEILKRIFSFIENLANNEDVKVQEVVYATVCEYLSGNEGLLSKAKNFMGPETVKMAKAINRFWWHENDI